MKSYEQKLEQARKIFDAVTSGLPNGSFFVQEMKELIEETTRDITSLDRFGKMNASEISRLLDEVEKCSGESLRTHASRSARTPERRQR